MPSVNSRVQLWLEEVSHFSRSHRRIALPGEERTRLIGPVTLILKTTDLSAAGYALSVGSGGAAVSSLTAHEPTVGDHD